MAPQGLSNEQVVRYVVEGGVMERPEHCPDRLYELMRACWAHRAVARPSFLRLVADLAPTSQPHFRARSFFHSAQGQEMYALQRTAMGQYRSAPASPAIFISKRLLDYTKTKSRISDRKNCRLMTKPLYICRECKIWQPVRESSNCHCCESSP